MTQSSPSPARAGRLRRLAASAGTLLLTAGLSAKVVLLAALGRLDRAKADRYARVWAARMLRTVDMRLSVHGAPPDFSDGRRYLILCTHSSHFDIPVTFAALPGSIRMLAKRELFRIPLFGAALRASEFPAIDRSNAHQARRDLQAARRMMESGIVVWAAPEGTRSPDGRLLPFKRGCFHLALDTGAIIVPVAIHGIHNVLPAHSLSLGLGHSVTVRVGEPLDASTYDAKRMTELMSAVRDRLQALLDACEVPRQGETVAPKPETA